MKDIRREQRSDTPVTMRPEYRPDEHPDRRFRRTDRILRDTLLEMLETRRIVNITTTDLCRRADVSRNTFYTHYTSVEHLYDDMENDFVRQLVDAVDATPSWEAGVASTERVLGIIRANRQLAEALVRGNVASDFYRKLYPLVREKIVGTFEVYAAENARGDAAGRRGAGSPAERVLSDGTPVFGPLYLYLFQGTRAVIERWVADGMVGPAHDIAELLTDTAMRLFGV